MGKLWESRDGKYCVSWFFLVVWGCRAARFGFVADAAAEISIYPRLPVRRPVHTNKQIYIYIYTDISFFMRLYLVEIYMRTERIKTFKNTTCSTCRRTCPTYLVRSISCISILMLHISISSVTGLISKKTSGRILVLHLHNHRRHSFHRQVWFLDLLSQSLRPLYLTF